MQPTIQDDDTLVCFQIQTLKDFRPGYVYALVLDDGIQIKRLFWANQPDNLLLLSSDNTLFKSHIIPITDVRQLWQVKMRLTTDLRPAINTDEARLRHLEDDVRQIKALLSPKPPE